jgi:hypothetical protein
MPEPTTDENGRRTKLLRDEVEVVAASLNFSAKFGNRDVGYSVKLRVLAEPPQKSRAGNVEHPCGGGAIPVRTLKGGEELVARALVVSGRRVWLPLPTRSKVTVRYRSA